MCLRFYYPRKGTGQLLLATSSSINYRKRLENPNDCYNERFMYTHTYMHTKLIRLTYTKLILKNIKRIFKFAQVCV